MNIMSVEYKYIALLHLSTTTACCIEINNILMIFLMISGRYGSEFKQRD